MTQRFLNSGAFLAALIATTEGSYVEPSPNATGVYAIPGYDINAPWSVSATPVEGWKAQMNLTISGQGYPDRFGPSMNGPGYAAGLTRVSYIPPEGINATESQWTICNTRFALSAEVTDKAQDDDGTCAFVSEECLRELKTAWVKPIVEHKACFTVPDTLPNSCKQSLGSVAETNRDEAFASSIDGITGRTTAFEEQVANASLVGHNGTIVAQHMRTIHPILSIWLWNNLTFAELPVSNGSDAVAFAHLNCFRANRLENGSTTDAPTQSSSTSQPSDTPSSGSALAPAGRHVLYIVTGGIAMLLARL
ncbi:hypothetical protein JX265_008075 [Neoarthrinium moseri]|uniref:Uncharacterized protein n=1 Tax=Neoarthrinium moseri TaxID=1658444 RepID=A0A9Q0AP08_9PEZI|nr:uncharacterized protein JN550_004480 [Neoarthrinium moseri]KAI1865752.1 hypothetical protein JX265_008075 [Neoarthrinium moseri]KAI1871486.1 hypothetical protein JN550_004480 [Neoarthrinium moseri]